AITHFIQHHEVFPNQPADRVNAVWRLPMHKITIARWLKHLALETFGDAEVSLVENSVDTTQFHAPPRGRRQSPTIGFLYSDVPWKGVADTCAVVERLRARLPDLRVRCFGSNPLAPQVPLPPGAEFTLRPPQSRLREIYASLDLWLCASHAEGFHLPPLEAMACRTPVVATEVGGAVEIIEPGKNGFLAPVRDVDQLAHHAAHVLTLPNEAWVAMSQAAHERAHRYTWDDATTLFERALEHAVERAARGQIAGGLPRATSTDRRA
ncbi:MAG: glycosyltransferase family 4 protein, partial [Dehalococcoidia bacterium]